MAEVYDFFEYKKLKEKEKGNAIVPTELQEHMALMEWINWHPVLRHLIIHVPNEGKRSPWYGLKLKKMGLRKGVSDFFLPLPRAHFHGLWIELKKDKMANKTPEQIEWIERMESFDYSAHFAYGFESAKEIILEYVKLGAPYHRVNYKDIWIT